MLVKIGQQCSLPFPKPSMVLCTCHLMEYNAGLDIGSGAIILEGYLSDLVFKHFFNRTKLAKNKSEESK